MRAKTIFFLLFIPLFSVGQWCDPYNYGILKAQVYGNTVLLKDDTANRNCGVHYEMQVSRLSSDTLIWRQVDFGSVFGCNCHFNLSVTIDSLIPGDYFAKVYYTDSTLFYQCYVGVISFSIAQPQHYQSFIISGQNQSNCFLATSINDNHFSTSYLSAFPNPSDGVITIKTNLKGEKRIRITDLLNNCIVKYITEKEEDQIDLSQFPDACYLITIESRGESIHKKICKMK